jgi:hypothetical protein
MKKAIEVTAYRPPISAYSLLNLNEYSYSAAISVSSVPRESSVSAMTSPMAQRHLPQLNSHP